MPPRAIRPLLRSLRALPHVLRGGLVFGSYPICQTRTLFVEEGKWLRSLAVTEWGRNVCEFIEKPSGLKKQVVRLHDRRRGIDGEFREVFISRKDR